jgi:hypothetical protein
MEGGFVHLLMGMIGTEVAGSAGIGVARFFQGKSVRSVAAVAPFLHDVAALAKGRADLLGDTQVFSMGAHPIPPHGVPALAELLQLVGVAFPPHFSGKTMAFCSEAAWWSTWQVIQWTPFLACLDSTQD